MNQVLPENFYLPNSKVLFTSSLPDRTSSPLAFSSALTSFRSATATCCEKHLLQFCQTFTPFPELQNKPILQSGSYLPPNNWCLWKSLTAIASKTFSHKLYWKLQQETRNAHNHFQLLVDYLINAHNNYSTSIKFSAQGQQMRWNLSCRQKPKLQAPINLKK